MPKDFYTIRDFYNSLQNPDRVPTTHRHFQVYLYPIYYYNGQVITNCNGYVGNDFYKGKLWQKASRGWVTRETSQFTDYGITEGNDFFAKWFTEETMEQFSLAIQNIKFPTSFGTPTTSYKSPFGDYFGVDNNRFYGTSINGNEVSFQLIDQMSPFFQKKINHWIFTVNRCTIPNQAGTLFPKVNMAIKYFREDQVWMGNTPTPNFIYYFKEAFPVKFDTCTIDHSGSDSEGDLRRTLVFNFNTMYVLHDQAFAERYKLGYLFEPVHIY